MNAEYEHTPDQPPPADSPTDGNSDEPSNGPWQSNGGASFIERTDHCYDSFWADGTPDGSDGVEEAGE